VHVKLFHIEQKLEAELALEKEKRAHEEEKRAGDRAGRTKAEKQLRELLQQQNPAGVASCKCSSSCIRIF
jgi:hypothetical protein